MAPLSVARFGFRGGSNELIKSSKPLCFLSVLRDSVGSSNSALDGTEDAHDPPHRALQKRPQKFLRARNDCYLLAFGRSRAVLGSPLFEAISGPFWPFTGSPGATSKGLSWSWLRSEGPRAHAGKGVPKRRPLSRTRFWMRLNHQFWAIKVLKPCNSRTAKSKVDLTLAFRASFRALVQEVPRLFAPPDRPTDLRPGRSKSPSVLHFEPSIH